MEQCWKEGCVWEGSVLKVGSGAGAEHWQEKQRWVPGQGLWGLTHGGSASRVLKACTAPAGRGISAACQVMPLLSVS